MPARSKVAMLPEEVRAELERRIVERSFSGYQDLADWLQAQGYQIAHDSIQRHGARLARQIDAVKQLTHEAHAIAAAIDNSDTTVIDVSIQLIHQRVFALLLEEPGSRQESSSEGVSAPDSDSARRPALGLPELARMTRILADLNRITMARQRAGDAQAKQPTRATRAEKKGKGGLSEEGYHAIRNVLLGINPFDPEHSDEAEGAEGSNNAYSDDGGFQAEEPSWSTSEPPPLELPLDAADGAETQLDADRRSSTPKTGRLSALRGETVPVAASAGSALGSNATKPNSRLEQTG